MKAIFKLFYLCSRFFYAASFCLTIVTSNYPAFDIASHVVGDKAKVKVLLNLVLMRIDMNHLLKI